MISTRRLSLAAVLLAVLSVSLFAQLNPQLYQSIKWRNIGPFRAGRTVGAVGIPKQPNVFFIGVNNGGVRKTTDAGRTWQPIFDDQPTGSIGDVALCEAQPNVIYVGSGEGLPLRPDLSVGDGVYKSTDGGKTWRNVGLRVRTMPVIFSPVDKKTLYFATNVLWKTENGGNSWDIISPDLTREKYDVPASVGKYATKEMETMPRRGVIYTVAPSHQDINTIWAGTDDGTIHRTTDGGKKWTNITPPELKSWMKVSLMDASPFDNDTAYAAINTLRIDDLRPHIYRTRDGGKTWKRIVNGIPNGTIVNVVREDPQRKGLLFAGTEQAVFVSFDDGENWQSLRLNMPATSIRDLVIKDDDIVVGTHGRSFWILDDITPLRQLNAEVVNSNAFLFKPQLATRVRRSLNTDTPIPPEEPMGQNPPDGAIINYYLATDAKEVVLEILDQQNNLVRRYASNDQPEQVNENTVAYPIYWARPPRVLPNKAGMQRWTWDFHYPPPAGVPRSLGMQAILRDTPTGPFGPTAAPGDYTVKLTVDGKSISQPLTLRLDPRVTTPPAGMAKMFEIAMRCYEGGGKVRAAQAEVRTLREQLNALTTRAGSNAITKTIEDLDKKVAALEGRTAGLDFFGVSNREPGLAGMSNGFLSLMNLVEGADVMPTPQAIAAADELQRSLNEVLARWNDIKSKDMKTLNDQLRQAGLPMIAN